MTLEKKLRKNLNEAIKTVVNNSSIENCYLKEPIQLIKESFEELLTLYLKDHEWEKIFGLIEKINLLIEACQSNNIGQDVLLLAVGNFFYKIDKHFMAFNYYKRAVQSSKESNLLAIESLDNILNNNIDRWHYRMLNDASRNEKYSQAIRKKIELLKGHSSKVRVLDIGTGTGLLSAQFLTNLQADSFRDIQIFACELNEFFYEISSRFLREVDQKKFTDVMNKHSNDLRIEDLGNSPIDLIITEIFDDCLLGENCLDTFYHAWNVNRLVNTNDIGHSQIIPKSAKVYLAAIESSEIRKSNMFRYTSPLMNINFKCLDNVELFSKYQMMENAEPYTTEDLNSIDFKFLTDPIELNELQIEFDNLEMLEHFCKYNLSKTITKRLKVVREGVLDAFVIWFDLNLDDEITLTNAPLKVSNTDSTSLCWHHGIFSNFQNNRYTVNSFIEVDVEMRKDCLLVSSKMLDEKKPITSKEIDINLNRSKISLLNNDPYQKFYIKWFKNQLDQILQTDNHKKKLKLGILSNTFNILALDILFVIRHELKEKMNIELELEYFDSSEDKVLSSYLHDIQVQVHCINDICARETLEGSISCRFDLDFLVCEPIDCNYSILRRNFMSDLSFIKSHNTNEMKIFPSGLKINGQCISSEELLKESCLTSNENLHMNTSNSQCDLQSLLSEFQVYHQYAISSNIIRNMKTLSNPCTILKLDLYNSSQIINETKEVNFKIVNSGEPSHVLYWYELNDETEKIEDNYGQNLNSLNQFAAISLINEKLTVSKDDNIFMGCKFENDTFHLNFKKLN